MARPRLFSFFNRAPDASSFLAPPVAVAGISSEPPDDVAEKLASVSARLESVIAERDQAQAKFREIETKFGEQASKFGEAQAAITALTTERDTLKAESARTREDLTQELRNQELATLAASQGIPAGAEIVPTNGAGKTKADELEEVLTEIKASKDPAQKGILAVKAATIRADIRAGK